MKTVLLAGWVFFGIETIILAAFWFSAKGADPIGSNIAKGVAVLFLPAVLIVGALLLWGTLSSNPYGVWGGAGLATIPVVVALVLIIPNFIPNFGRMFYQSNIGNFADSRLTAIARAMQSGNYARQRELLKGGGINWAARDRHGVTLLGLAIKQNQDMFAGPHQLEGLKILLEAGAPLHPESIRSNSEGPNSDLLMPVATGSKIEILEMLLVAGGDPNAVDYEGAPLAFLTYVDMPRLQLLVKHGANVNAVNPAPMANHMSLLMHYALNDSWEEVEFLLRQGADPNYRADDGATLASILSEKPAPAADIVKELLISKR